MSYEADEAYDVYREQQRKAIKEHTCSACKEVIRKGDSYWVITWIFDGYAGGIKRCLRCQTLHVHLRKLDPGYMWPAEQLDCGESYEDEWGSVPDEIIELAFITPDEAQNKIGG
jgi:hypothetical protein